MCYSLQHCSHRKISRSTAKTRPLPCLPYFRACNCYYFNVFSLAGRGRGASPPLALALLALPATLLALPATLVALALLAPSVDELVGQVQRDAQLSSVLRSALGNSGSCSPGRAPQAAAVWRVAQWGGWEPALSSALSRRARHHRASRHRRGALPGAAAAWRAAS